MRPIHVRILRDLPLPLAEAFAWLTDFQDDDAQRAGAVVKQRRVVARTAHRIVYEGETEVLGRRSASTTEVQLQPPDTWEARVTKGPRTGSWTTYHLTPSRKGSQLDVHYRFTHEKATTRLLMRLVQPKIRADLVKMWEGYEADMAQELAAAQRA